MRTFWYELKKAFAQFMGRAMIIMFIICMVIVFKLPVPTTAINVAI